jgi:hypothetical protein
MVKPRESLNAYAWVFVNSPNGSTSSLWQSGGLVVQHMLPYITQNDSISSTLFEPKWQELHLSIKIEKRVESTQCSN